MKIAVIGAGASGIMAALIAAWHGATVTLFERNATLGRKLLVTGSGRCNLTNDQVSSPKYACEDANWVATLLSRFDVPALLDTLINLGIPTYKTWDGWYYPLSNSAHSVVDTLTQAVTLAGIHTKRSHQVIDIAQQNKGFNVTYIHQANQNTDFFDRVIISSGGKAYPSLGTKGELFPVLAKLGHTIVPIHPALAPVLADLGPLKSLQGVRLDLGVTLYHGGTRLMQTAGNMIFTEWGLNGPAVMDLSHLIPESPGESFYLSLDLLHFIENEFLHLLKQKRNAEIPVSLFLSAFFPPKVAQCYTRLAGFGEKTLMAELNEDSITRMRTQLKDTRLKAQGVRGYKFCQASTGGVPVSEVNPTTLESRVHSGLYLTGETLDVVGRCGGFNLHFAFASGILAGQAAGNTGD